MPVLPTFTTLGHGPVVLMLHGSGGGFRSFAPQVETLASLGWRAVAWNMPGYGHSAPIEPYAFKGLAASCAALIESLLPPEGERRVALVGQGMGGMVALELALRRPDLLGQLVLVATADAVVPGDAYSRHIAQCSAWLDEDKPMEAIADTLLPRLIGPAALPAGVQLATFCQSQVRGGAWRRALAAMTDFDRRADLGRIGQPTLLVAGEHDRLTPTAEMQAMARRLPAGRCVSLAGAGHLPHLECPDEFDALLLDFLRTERLQLH